ncbi:MAG: alginate export family protein [Sphingomonas sp.]
MKIYLWAAAALVAAGPACAQDFTLKPLAEARLRYEHVDQDDIAAQADAVTLRARAGVQATTGPWRALVEAQGTLAIDGDYYDGLHGAATRPLVADPQNVALYRAQLQYVAPTLTLTAGRQIITLDDQRFVGNVGFRQNAQTFDALRAEWRPLNGLKADVSYVWDVRTIWGVDGAGAKQPSVGGNNVFANLSYATPIGTLTGFAYLVDQDEAAVQGYRLSSQTYGARLAGARPLGGGFKLTYQLSAARQSDWHRNPNDYAASYYLADASLSHGQWQAGAGYEVLGADHGVALTSFQTPLATGFKFQGWADKFLTDPPDGVRDLRAGGGYRWPKLIGFDSLALQADWHRFDSDRNNRHYGDEIDLLAAATKGRTQVSARFARYLADRFATDTSKVWLEVDWAY